MTALLPPPARAGARRTQAERTESTRAKLLDATLELLVEQGWARTTTQAVAERAGVSRGAQLHHFPTKNVLVINAVGHLAGKRYAEIRAELARRRGRREGLARVVDVLDRAFSGPLFYAALELWVAARTDAELRAALLPLERAIGRELHTLSADLLRAAGVADPDDARTRVVLDLTVDLLRGIGIATVLTGDERRRRRLLHAWTGAMSDLLGLDLHDMETRQTAGRWHPDQAAARQRRPRVQPGHHLREGRVSR